MRISDWSSDVCSSDLCPSANASGRRRRSSAAPAGGCRDGWSTRAAATDSSRQALEAGHVDRAGHALLAVALLALDLFQQQALFLLVERVEHLLANVEDRKRVV